MKNLADLGGLSGLNGLVPNNEFNKLKILITRRILNQNRKYLLPQVKNLEVKNLVGLYLF